jgi:phage terminase small subunit
MGNGIERTDKNPRGAGRKKQTKLTFQEEKFCLEYFKLCNATQAAKACGWSEKQAAEAGSDLLKKELIQLRLDQLREKFELECKDVIKLNLYKLAEAREKGLGNLPVRKGEGQLIFEPNISGAVSAIKEILKVAGAYVLDNQQHMASLPTPTINIINTAPKRASSEDEIED